MIIRDVSDGDCERITDIYNHYIEHTNISLELERVTVQDIRKRAAQLLAGRCPYLVAEQGGRVCGFAYAHPWKERLAYHFSYECSIYVDHTLLTQGIGSNLLKVLIQRSKEAGVRNLIACITADNIRSIKFHEKFGFKQASHFVSVGYKFSEYLDVIDLQLQL